MKTNSAESLGDIASPINFVAAAETLNSRRRHTDRSSLAKTAEGKCIFESIVGDSPQIMEIIRLIEKVSAANASLLITGESGVGKELVARAVHAKSSRASAPFVAINCAAMPKDLLESELFGHKKGSFTGAIVDKVGKIVEATNGTLFLDEIGDMPIQLQAKMLRVLQEMEVTPVGANKSVKLDVRIVAATNKDLMEEIAAGNFREDLFYRLAVVQIHVPSLRERADDIPLLVRHFLSAISPNEEVVICQDAQDALKRYKWKGNIRELRNTIESILVFRENNQIHLGDLPAKILNNGGQKSHYSFRFTPAGIGFDDVVRDLLIAALRQSGWNQSHAARLLKIPRHTLLHKMKKCGIRGKEL